MEQLDFSNPFGAAIHTTGAPVYHAATVSSTMDEARLLAEQGLPHGTVISADFQEAGRGRVRNRPWLADRGKNLFFTILLRYSKIEDIPQAMTLKTGLAIAQAVEDFAPPLAGMVQVKWPNDIMAGSGGSARKIAGILTEGDGTRIFIGIGVNVAQTEFPPELRSKAGSIALALVPRAGPSAALPAESRFTLLEKILARLHAELETAKDGGGPGAWQNRLTERLYRRGEQVCFVEGAADSGKEVWGRLTGIGSGGELLIVPDGGTEARAFVTGELRVY
ncbi:biotin--[acetyl-CoA-carboxylase] ligase [Spirochaetia bacterium]|nr:biotin--[acetyl-CoA-carboxylase] ligase [Spirochaetia bacterium]